MPSMKYAVKDYDYHAPHRNCPDAASGSCSARTCQNEPERARMSQDEPGRAGASYCSRTDHCNSRTKRRHGQKNYHSAINWGKHLEQQQQQPQEQQEQEQLKQMQH
ncbi:uncharacterized protein LOC116804894 isoform X2 [Drosophila mojavensis]|uniref:uncharacterized protein LOC116804894 isoform X2 n=1 Tax=Drosophila mojavensis TaxID=7230 RepID=UPI0013EE66C1|nr:uncharacterized protein LOC116804894 isoform X2 [Drosophila mojavensis]